MSSAGRALAHGEVVDLLGSTEIFSRAAAGLLDQLASSARQRRTVKGQVLFAQGDAPDGMYVVAEGTIAVSVLSPEGDEHILDTLRVAATFGEVSLLDGGPRSAFARAIESGRIVVISRDHILDALRADPGLVDGLFVALGTTLRRLTTRAADQVFLDLPGRVAKYLLDQPSTDRVVEVGLSQGTIAGLLGGTRQGVNQALSTFQRLGWLRVQGQHVVLLDIPQLRRRAGR